MEAIISSHPFVRDAIIFGRAQIQAGVLIDLADEKKFEPSNIDRLADLRREIWATIEEANKVAPKHSRILKEVRCLYR